jgi:hypothetical protein
VAEVIALPRAGGEDHVDPRVVLGKFGDRFAEQQSGRWVKRAAQDVDQVLARDLDVVGTVADLIDGQFGDEIAAAVDELDAFGHRDPMRADLIEYAHLGGDLDGVTADVDRGAVDPQMGRSLDDGDIVAVGAEVHSGAQSRDAPARYEDSHEWLLLPA